MRIAVAQLAFPPRTYSRETGTWIPDDVTSWPGLPLDGIQPIPPLHRLEADIPSLKTVRRGIETTYTKEAKNKIVQILHTLIEWQADLVIFPEFCLPPGALPSIAEFCEEISIVGGVGHLRPEDVETLRDIGVEDAATGTNVAVAIARNLRYAAAKRNGSPFERLDAEGGGISVVDIPGRRESLIRSAIAVCMDFVLAGPNLGGLAQQIELIAVPAWSGSTSDFTGIDTRDAILGFANAGLAGGQSTISAPGISQGVFTARNSVKPLPPRTEGVILFDYEGPWAIPTRTRAPSNELVARASLIYSGSPEAAVDTSILEEIRSWSFAKYRDGAYDKRLVELKAEAVQPLLTDSIAELSTVLSGNPVSPADFAMLRRHIILRQSQSFSELAYQSLEALNSSILDILPITESPDIAGNLLKYSREVQKRLVGSVRLEFRSDQDHFAPASYPQPAAAPPEDETTIAAIRLGKFKTEDALQTFPAQLAVLNSLIREDDDRLRLQYSLRIESRGKTDPAAFFDVHLIGKGISEAEAQRVGEGLGQLIGVALSPGWNLSAAPQPAPPSPDDEVIFLRLARTADSDPKPAIAEDWSIIVDFLRTQLHDVALTLYVRPEQLGADTLEFGRVQTTDRGQSMDDDDLDRYVNEFGGFARAMKDAQASSTGFVADTDRRAAGFLWRIALSEVNAQAKLRLTVMLHGRGVTDELAYSIGALIFGGVPFEIGRSEPICFGSLLSSADALRVFHPPFGAIQGRGLPNRRSTALPCNSAKPLPAAGTLLGEVTISGARNDRRVPIFLTDDVRMRHMYIIGRTGSGKTNLLKNLVKDDLDNGRSIVVIDPHGALAEYCARQASSASHEFAYLDLGSSGPFIPNVDPFSLDDNGTDSAFDDSVEEVTDILRSLTFFQYTGPRFSDLLSLLFRSLREASSFTCDLATAYEILQSPLKRNRLISELSDDGLTSAWNNLLRIKAGEVEDLTTWAASKLTVFSRNERVRSVVGTGLANVSIERFVAQASTDRRCLFVRIPEWRLGNTATSFIGRLIISRLRRVRFGTEVEDSNLVTGLYVDEFQRFVSKDFETFVAESRKFGVALTIANQNLEQLSAFDEYEGAGSKRLREALLSNVGTLVAFNHGADDRTRLSAEMDVSVEALSGIAPFEAIANVSAGDMQTGPFSLRIRDSRSSPGSLSSLQSGVEGAKESGVQPNRRRTTSPEQQLRLEGPAQTQIIDAPMVTTPSTTLPNASSDLSDLLSRPAGAGEGLDTTQAPLDSIDPNIDPDPATPELIESLDDIHEYLEMLMEPLNDERLANDQIVPEWLRRYVSLCSASAVPERLIAYLSTVIAVPDELASLDTEQLVDIGIGGLLAHQLYIFSRPQWVGSGLKRLLVERHMEEQDATELVANCGALICAVTMSDNTLAELGLDAIDLSTLEQLAISDRDFMFFLKQVGATPYWEDQTG